MVKDALLGALRTRRLTGKFMKSILAAFLVAAAMIVAPSAPAQDKSAEVADLQTLRAAAKADKHAYVASALQLTSAEANKFWPAYDAYQRDLDMINRRRNVALEGLVALDRPISDLYAKTLAAELIATDEAEVKSRRTMQNRVMRALPAKKAARYLQIESKLRALQFYDIAVAFPLVK
jgi:hypothetical protein